ncbi:MAG: hypothetical protein ABI806_19880 [Candidatus Solibacter sp.]
MWISAALLLSLCVPAFGQTLEIPPVTVDRGSANIFRIILKPRAEKPLTALQWDLVYRDCFRIEPPGVVPGGASEAAGKSLTCVRKPQDGANSRLACILAGGDQTFAAGVIAIVRFEAIQNSPKGDSPVDLENVVGVSPALEPVPMKGAQTSITIR